MRGASTRARGAESKVGDAEPLVGGASSRVRGASPRVGGAEPRSSASPRENGHRDTPPHHNSGSTVGNADAGSERVCSSGIGGGGSRKSGGDGRGGGGSGGASSAQNAEVVGNVGAAAAAEAAANAHHHWGVNTKRGETRGPSALKRIDSAGSREREDASDSGSQGVAAPSSENSSTLARDDSKRDGSAERPLLKPTRSGLRGRPSGRLGG